ncbi:MAG: cell division protein FtsQ/DivIB [Candidatus Omnitrophica bacterium]|nr:cell division protein FtsQ/DivIB [Candidatus Omnitrophota bacterium]
MPRKKKPKISPVILKVTGVVILSLVVGIFICNLLYQFLTNSEYFTVKRIVVEKTLRFIDADTFSDIKGKNIFTVDLPYFQRKLRYKYPQITDLKVIRRFPNQIDVIAKQRDPVAQTQLNEKILSLDASGVVLAITEKDDKDLPLLKGIELNPRQVSLGMPLRPKEFVSGLDIIKEFNRNSALSAYKIKSLELENPSKINLFLSNDLKVIVDKNDPNKKMTILGIVLKQDNLNFEEIRYIDLRFKEPILGKK